MLRKARALIAAVTLATGTGTVAAQVQVLPPSPVPVAQQPPAAAPVPYPAPPVLNPGAPPPPADGARWQPGAPPGPVVAPPPPVTVQQRFVPAVEPQGLLMPPAQQPGFFGSIEVGVLAPEISGTPGGTVTVLGTSRVVNLPNADLDWTGSPKVEIGYRLPDCAGEFILGYRSVVSEGTQTLLRFDPAGAAALQSRLNMNVGDIDYSTGTRILAPFWDVSFRLGARVAGVYYDNRATGPTRTQRASNNFVGAGPHAGVEVARQLDLVPGLALFGRIDGALVIGEVTQSFEETQLLNGRTLVGGASRRSEGQTVPVLTFMTGLSYSPTCASRWLRFTGGYQFEQWWGVGDAGPSSGDLRLQGLFFRGEFNF